MNPSLMAVGSAVELSWEATGEKTAEMTFVLAASGLGLPLTGGTLLSVVELSIAKGAGAVRNSW